MKSKSKTRTCIQIFLKFISTQYSAKVKVIRSDNRLEFAMSYLYSSLGILHQTSCVETPQQNSVVERKHRHLLNVTRSLLFQTHLPKCFWSYALTHAVFLINRLPTPYEIFLQKPPTFLDLKVFGCLSFASTLLQKRDKLDPRARKCVFFLGYKFETKGYVVFDLHTRNIFISRHVIFHEHIFPYSHNPSSINDQPATHNDDIPDPLCFDDSFLFDHIPSPQNEPVSNSTSDFTNDTPHSASDLHSNHINESCLRKSERVSQRPSYLKDFHCYNIANVDVLDPIFVSLSYDNLSASHYAYIFAITVNQEPNTYKQAVQHPHWQNSMDDELQALHHNNTWIITDLPPGKKPIGCKWVYKIKYHANGTIERYKARLVAKGYSQVEDIDFFDTSSPIAKLTTIILLLAISSSNNSHLHQLDVHNAFLHGDLEEEVYMNLPPGLSTSKSNQVCKLTKSLYGLKQSSKQWFSKLTTALISKDYKQSLSDPSLFIKNYKGSFTSLLIYVDDLVLAGNDLEEITAIKSFLNKKFNIKDLGYLNFFS